MAYAMKIHLKKNAAANGLELKERLQGLTATDVTHSRESKAAILIFYIWPHKYCENPLSQITKHSLPINSQNKTGISAPSDLHSQVASLCFYSYIQFFFLFFLCSRSFRKRLRDDAKQCKIVLLRYAKALDNIIVIKCN